MPAQKKKTAAHSAGAEIPSQLLKYPQHADQKTATIFKMTDSTSFLMQKIFIVLHLSARRIASQAIHQSCGADPELLQTSVVVGINMLSFDGRCIPSRLRCAALEYVGSLASRPLRAGRLDHLGASPY
jgi:hypothetical protein